MGVRGTSLIMFRENQTCTTLRATISHIPAKSKSGREEGDGTENVINCRDVCRKLS